MIFSRVDRILLHLINRKVNYLMSQLDDLKSAVSNELADAQSLLDKLQASTTPATDPQVADLISQLQDSHNKIQAALNPPAPATQVPSA